MECKQLESLIQDILNPEQNQISEKEYLTHRQFIEMSAYENDLYNRKVKVIAGIDEAGRGPLAGPVVAAAVILPNDFYLPGVNDSKQLSAKKRDYFYEQIVKSASCFGVGIVSVEDIDRYNIYNSTKIAMIQAILALTIKPKHLLIDAMHLEIDIPQTSIIKGDAKSISIASASIIAKVTRDRYMKELDLLYPEYHFNHNAGYGTHEHLEAIKKFGFTPHHRRTFDPVRTMILEQNTLFD